MLLKLIEVSILSTTKSEALFSSLTEKLNQLAAKSDAQKVLYGHELLNHLAPIVLSLSAGVHVIPAETMSQLLSAPSDFSGEYSLHYFCAHYLIQFHNNFSVSIPIPIMRYLLANSLSAFECNIESHLCLVHWSRHGT